MAVAGLLIGSDAATYYNVNLGLLLDGNTVTPSFWLGDSGTKEAGNIMDASENVASELVDSTTREEARQGWAAEIAVIKNGEVQFDVRWEPSDEFTGLLLQAWDTQSAMTLGFFDRRIDTASLAFTGGSGSRPLLGTVVSGVSSAAVGLTTASTTESGTFAGADAQGTIEIQSKTGVFQPGENLSWSGGNAVLDSAATAQGIIANFSISLNKLESLRDIQKASVTVTVATFPEWYVVP